MTEELVSIVVPVYNMGNSLEVCVDSLLKQKYYNIEIVLVDDGSRDNNIVTREEYHEYNQRFSDKLHNAEEAKRELEKKKEKAVVEGKREHPWIEDFKSYQNITQLDRKAVVTLIDKIIVYGKDRLEIQFKYADEIQEMTEVAQNIREIEEKEGRFKCGA